MDDDERSLTERMDYPIGMLPNGELNIVAKRSTAKPVVIKAPAEDDMHFIGDLHDYDEFFKGAKDQGTNEA
jgi:hypothetical protein